jgi:hypothetical protein
MRRLLLALAFLILCAARVQAQAAYVSHIACEDESGAASTLTCASVVGSGGNIVVALVTWRQNAAQTVTGVTYGGAAMTHCANPSGDTWPLVIDGGAVDCYYYLNPAGTASVVWTFSATITGSSQGGALVFSGVDVSGTPIGTIQSSEVASATATATSDVTVDADDMIVDVVMQRDSAVLTIGANQTERSNNNAAGSIQGRTSTQDGADGGAMSWTIGAATNFAHASIPLNGAAAGAGAPKRLLLMGIGGQP